MGYENAESTKLLATYCGICGKELRDAPSVQRGIGPDCARKYGIEDADGEPDWLAASKILPVHQLESTALNAAWGNDPRRCANVLIHRIACEQGSDLARRCAAALWFLGFHRCALAIGTHRSSAIKAILVEVEGDQLVVKSPFSETWNFKARQVPGSRWNAERKVRTFPAAQRHALWVALQAAYPQGTLVLGSKAALL